MGTRALRLCHIELRHRECASTGGWELRNSCWLGIRLDFLQTYGTPRLFRTCPNHNRRRCKHRNMHLDTLQAWDAKWSWSSEWTCMGYLTGTYVCSIHLRVSQRCRLPDLGVRGGCQHCQRLVICFESVVLEVSARHAQIFFRNYLRVLHTKFL